MTLLISVQDTIRVADTVPRLFVALVRRVFHFIVRTARKGVSIVRRVTGHSPPFFESIETTEAPR